MKRFLRVTEEAVFGTFPTGSPVQNYVRLDSADAFKVMSVPEFWTIMSGSGFAVPALNGTQVTGLGATLSIPLDYAQAAMWFGLGTTRINTGQTVPWTTTEIAGDYASVSIEFGWTNIDGTERRKRFLGCKLMTLAVTCSRDAPVARITMGFVGSTPQGNSYDSSTDPTATMFPEPADSVFPTTPVLFQHLKGGLTINNVARSNFQSISFSIQNRMKAYFDESRFANLIRNNGRTMTFSGSSRLKATPDDRTAYESGTTQISVNSATWTSPAAHTVALTLNGNNYFTTINEAFALDEEIYYGFTLQNQLDTSVPGDFQIVVT